jgi:hypothetical protein
MTYKYYKFPNKESVPKQWPLNVSVNEVGIMYNNDEVYNELGELVTPPTPKEGWHVNVCYQGQVDLDSIKQYEIQVNTPLRKWFGQPE